MIKSLTDQEVYDNALFGIRKQNCFSRMIRNEWKPRCFYRLNDGDRYIRCAIGQSISDELYLHSFEDDGGSDGLISENSSMQQLFMNVNERLMNALQEIHDNCPSRYPDEQFEADMKNAANEFGLIYTPKPQEKS